MSGLNIISYPCSKNRCYKQSVKRTPIGIQIHSIGCAQGTAKSVADYWNSPNVSALVHYICDSDTLGKVLYTLPESVYAWADAGYGNRNLITIEMCESDFMTYTGGASFKITDKKRFKDDILRSYETCVMLCADICKRYGWNPFTKLPSGLYLISSHNEGRLAGLSSGHVDPDHIWREVGKNMDIFRRAVLDEMNGDGSSITVPVATKWYRVRQSWTDAQSQLGAYEVNENAVNNCPYGYAVYDDAGNEIYRNRNRPYGTVATSFNGLSETVAAKKILEMVHECDKSGILYSVSAAQMILESGYVTTRLSRIANNCFGMKVTLSGNTWANSSWDGKSKVTLPTWENYGGNDVTINADFRSYPCIEDSIKDHSAYLLGAMNGSKRRYAGLLNAKSYKEAITIIKNGGYATDPNYISKICSIIQRFGLDKYDAEIIGKAKEDAPVVVPEKKTVYRVQVGRYKSLALANGWKATVAEITKLKCSVEPYEGEYQVICGSFEDEISAKQREFILKKDFLVPCEVKEVTI